MPPTGKNETHLAVAEAEAWAGVLPWAQRAKDCDVVVLSCRCWVDGRVQVRPYPVARTVSRIAPRAFSSSALQWKVAGKATWAQPLRLHTPRHGASEVVRLETIAPSLGFVCLGDSGIVGRALRGSPVGWTANLRVRSAHLTRQDLFRCLISGGGFGGPAWVGETRDAAGNMPRGRAGSSTRQSSGMVIEIVSREAVSRDFFRRSRSRLATPGSAACSRLVFRRVSAAVKRSSARGGTARQRAAPMGAALPDRTLPAAIDPCRPQRL